MYDLHAGELEGDAQIQEWKLRNAETALASGALYTEAKARCKALDQSFGKWLKKYGPHKWRMANYLMRAVRLGIHFAKNCESWGVPNAIAQAQGREPSAASALSKARRKANSLRLAELQTPEAIDLVIQGHDHAEFIAACRHRARPYPWIQRPGFGIEHLRIDTGAYSAHNSGETINLTEYCDFCHRVRDLAHNVTLVNLDHIDDEDRPEEAAQIGFANFEYMRSRGLDPMPVVHEGEDLNWLRRYLDIGCTYIGLSGLTSHAADFFAQAWDMLCDSSGNPLVRVHAFGESRTQVLLAYPWASDDSSSPSAQEIHTRSTTRIELAERVYWPARRYARLQREVRAFRPVVPFKFHFAIGTSAWRLPTLHAVGHRSALISYWYWKSPTDLQRLRTFIANPHALLATEPYKSNLELLDQVAERYRLHYPGT